MATTEHPSVAPVGGLSSWRDGPAKQAIVTFVARVCGEDGSEPVPVADRLAVFDNDGTLWCEKPMPIQLDFILRRLVEMAEADPALRERQPWKAAHERDYDWLSALMAEHYAGDASGANRELGDFDMKASSDHLANVIRSVKADQVSLRLQNEFFERAKHRLDEYCFQERHSTRPALAP